jgi:hypothetical protein
MEYRMGIGCRQPVVAFRSLLASAPHWALATGECGWLLFLAQQIKQKSSWRSLYNMSESKKGKYVSIPISRYAYREEFSGGYLLTSRDTTDNELSREMALPPALNMTGLRWYVIQYDSSETLR